MDYPTQGQAGRLTKQIASHCMCHFERRQWMCGLPALRQKKRMEPIYSSARVSRKFSHPRTSPPSSQSRIAWTDASISLLTSRRRRLFMWHKSASLRRRRRLASRRVAADSFIFERSRRRRRRRQRQRRVVPDSDTRCRLNRSRCDERAVSETEPTGPPL